MKPSLTGEFGRRLNLDGIDLKAPDVELKQLNRLAERLTEQQLGQGVFDLLLHANKNDENYVEMSDIESNHYTFQGDLQQMFTQEDFLKKHYPAVKTKDEFNQALALIFKNRVWGWWQYKDEIIKLGICDLLEWQQAIDQYVK